MPRKGQWVKLNGQVGIWLEGQFHQVNEMGITVGVLTVDPQACVPVTNVNDIPEPRRLHLPDGYNPHTKRVEEKTS